MKPIRILSAALALAGLALMVSPPSAAHALSAYDPPQVSLVKSGYFDVILQVRAGGSGAPAGFTIQWMTLSDFQLRGGWPADPSDPALLYCTFNGIPTLHLSPESPSYELAPNAGIRTEPGDLFDATGVITDDVNVLTPGVMYVFRARAEGDAGGLPSAFTETFSVATLSAECTQGFWKNHPESWPTGSTPMLLGTVSYSKSQLLMIFNQPAVGNGLISLAHQLIAAKLNIANGSDPSAILATIASADALIDGLVVPPIGGGFLAPSLTDPLTQMLDDYNNGRLGGVQPCPTSVRPSTWGAVKQLYR